MSKSILEDSSTGSTRHMESTGIHIGCEVAGVRNSAEKPFSWGSSLQVLQPRAVLGSIMRTVMQGHPEICQSRGPQYGPEITTIPPRQFSEIPSLGRSRF